MKLFRLSALTALLAMSFSLCALAQTSSYVFTRINPQPGCQTTFAQGINNLGQIVGYSSCAGSPQGFLLHNGTFSPVNVPNTSYSVPVGINDQGVVSGLFISEILYQGFRFDGSHFTTFDAPVLNPSFSPSTSAQGINNEGTIVGRSAECDMGGLIWCYNPQGFIRSAAGQFSFFTLGATTDINPFGINNFGQIVGFYDSGSPRGFLWDPGGSYIDLVYPGADQTYAYGINDLGQVVGSYSASSASHGFIYQASTYTTVDFPNSNYTYVTGINNLGQIVGYYNDGSYTYSFLATPKGTITGRVTDTSGLPVAGMPVIAYDFNGNWVAGSQTDGIGEYSFLIPPGTYHVEFFGNGTPGYYLTEWYDSKSLPGQADPVSVGIGQTVRLDAEVGIGGQVSGYVTDTAGQGIGLVHVEAHALNGDLVSDLVTNPNGSYWFNLPPGDYKLYFNAGQASGAYLSEWYNDEYWFNEADPVSVALNMTTTVNAQLECGGTIRGRVTEAATGNPVYNYFVDASDPVSGRWLTWVLTDVNGYYSLVVPNGTYKIQFENYNFQYNPHDPYNLAPEWYNNQVTLSQGEVVTIAGCQVLENIDAQLEPGARILGRVTDLAGAPLSGLQVRAEDLNGRTINYGLTDGNGDYTIKSLATGCYKVYFDTGLSNLLYVDEWYDDRPMRDTAAAVCVIAGEDVTGVDARLTMGGSIRGTITNGSGQGIERVHAAAYDLNGGLVISRPTNGDGTYALVVPPGTYKVSFNAGWAAGTYLSEWHQDKAAFSNADSVSVSAGRILIIDAQLATGSKIVGRVTDNLGAGIGRVHVAANDLDGNWVAGIPTEPDGNYSFTLPPGAYKVAFWTNDAPGYVSEWFNNKRELSDADRVDPAMGQTLALDAQLARYETLTISGFVLSPEDVGIPGVVLSGLPGPPVTDGSGFYSASVAYGWGCWTGQATPNLADYVFTPTSRSYNCINTSQINQNYVGNYQPPCPPPGQPGIPSPADLSTNISVSPTLAWSATTGTDAYDVYFGLTNPPPLVGTTTGNMFNLTGLAYGTTYYWRITARNNCGNASPSTLWRFTTQTDSAGLPLDFTILLNGNPFVDLAWGWRAGATDNFDNDMDGLSPPPTLDGDDAYFLSITGQASPLDKLRLDFRGVSEDLKTWRLVLRVADGKTMKLLWDPQTLPDDWDFSIQEADADWVGIAPARDLNGTPAELTLDNQTGELLTRRYLVRASRGFQLSLKAGGWNLVSLPIEAIEPSPPLLFGPNLLAVYEWDCLGKLYRVPSAIRALRGYWVAVSHDTDLVIAGVPPSDTSVHLCPGWNLVGPPETGVCPAGPPVLALYGWGWPPEYRYAVPALCEPGRGYWIAASEEASIW
jgi:probable HAF family extracellular repeat protein